MDDQRRWVGGVKIGPRENRVGWRGRGPHSAQVSVDSKGVECVPRFSAGERGERLMCWLVGLLLVGSIAVLIACQAYLPSELLARAVP